MARGIAHREWEVRREDYENDSEFRYAVQQEMSMAEHIGERLGVAIVAAPIRTRSLQGGSWFTVGWVFRTATVPSADTKPEPAEAELLEGALAESALVEDFDALAEVK